MTTETTDRKHLDIIQLENFMHRLSERHGKEAMKAIATLMHDLGSDTVITFNDGHWIPCDFLMQMAWQNGGQP